MKSAHLDAGALVRHRGDATSPRQRIAVADCDPPKKNAAHGESQITAAAKIGNR
jgi:hypothetical protein